MDSRTQVILAVSSDFFSSILVERVREMRKAPRIVWVWAWDKTLPQTKKGLYEEFAVFVACAAGSATRTKSALRSSHVIQRIEEPHVYSLFETNSRILPANCSGGSTASPSHSRYGTAHASVKLIACIPGLLMIRRFTSK